MTIHTMNRHGTKGRQDRISKESLKHKKWNLSCAKPLCSNWNNWTFQPTSRLVIIIVIIDYQVFKLGGAHPELVLEHINPVQPPDGSNIQRFGALWTTRDRNLSAGAKATSIVAQQRKKLSCMVWTQPLWQGMNSPSKLLKMTLRNQNLLNVFTVYICVIKPVLSYLFILLLSHWSANVKCYYSRVPWVPCCVNLEVERKEFAAFFHV